MKPWSFLKSPTGNLVIIVGFAVIGGYLMHRSNVREKARTSQMTKVADVRSHPLRESILRVGQPLKVPARGATEPASATVGEDGGPASRSHAVRSARTDKAEPKPRVLPISLFSGASANRRAPAGGRPS